MFRGDHPDLSRAMARARALADSRIGSEHLLLALTSGGRVAQVLGLATEPLREAIRVAGPAAVGADRATLAAVGVDVADSWVDLPPRREPLFPWRGAEMRRRFTRLDPPLGLDAQAAYEASLRLALARRDRDHRPEHLAIALTTFDPGVTWLLSTMDVDTAVLRARLTAVFPMPHRNMLLRTERRWGYQRRHADIARRYLHTTGRA